MSPPKVSLLGKDAQKWESDELSSEKGDSAEFPSVIVVETEHRARNFRKQMKRRQYKRVLCGIILVVFVSLAALLTLTIVNVLRRHHRLDWICLGYKGLPTNVHVDSDNQLIHASHDHDADTDTNSMNILHEYNRHLVAYKDVDSSTCYIDRLDETFEEGFQRWRSYEVGRNSSQVLKVISQSIEVEVLQHIGDIHIYAHCQNAQSFWVKEIDIREVTTEMRVVYV